MTTTEPVQLNEWQKSLAVEYAPMAERIAIREWNKKYRQIETVLPFEDVQALVYLGLVKACSHTEPGRDGLVTYFERYMMGEVQEYLRRLDHASRKVRGLINQLPNGDHPKNLTEIMIITECNEKEATAVLAAIAHSNQSLEGLAKTNESNYQAGKNNNEWESTTVIYNEAMQHNHLGDVAIVEDTWLDREGLALAISIRIKSMDKLSQAILVLNFVEDVSIAKIPEELDQPVSLVNKKYISAIENVRDFVVGWCAVA